jgi:hypothetical protein
LASHQFEAHTTHICYMKADVKLGGAFRTWERHTR